METPEEKVKLPKHQHTNLRGDRANENDIPIFDNPDLAIFYIARLQVNDACFVKRSCGGYTFAKVLSRSRKSGGDTILTMQVSDKGHTKTKTLSISNSPKYLCPLMHQEENRQPPKHVVDPRWIARMVAMQSHLIIQHVVE